MTCTQSNSMLCDKRRRSPSVEDQGGANTHCLIARMRKCRLPNSKSPLSARQAYKNVISASGLGQDAFHMLAVRLSETGRNTP